MFPPSLQSYTMRNGVLGVLGEVLAQVLRPDKMDNEQMKSVRDQCLDQLEVRRVSPCITVCVCVCVCVCRYRVHTCLN